MALDLYQLKTFRAFARIRNFTKTAERLFCHAIGGEPRVEKTRMLDRYGADSERGGEYGLTEAGEALFTACEKIFTEIDRFEAELQGGEQHLRQKLHLGAPVEFGTTVLVRQLGEFIRRHDHIQLSCHFSHSLHTSLLRDELDLIVNCRPCLHPDVERIFLFESVTWSSPPPRL